MKLKFRKLPKVKKSAQEMRLDFFFSRSIRSANQCQFKGRDKIPCSSDLQCVRVIGKNNLRVRWDKMNGLAICTNHNKIYSTLPNEFMRTVAEYWPEQYAYIARHKDEPLKETYESLEKQFMEERAQYLKLRRKEGE